jgi:hypothetical protein
MIKKRNYGSDSEKTETSTFPVLAIDLILRSGFTVELSITPRFASSLAKESLQHSRTIMIRRFFFEPERHDTNILHLGHDVRTKLIKRNCESHLLGARRLKSFSLVTSGALP